ncbi:peptidoglycan DD-metalloendopeptidase family protein, partial [Candidatus Gracilibacteria bacterium]|nr:peptidoglycan DD-metalloendopeptidase family protein [Candidatus Gracilibacteria bacterium]
MILIKAIKIRPKKILSIITLVSFIVSTTFSIDVKAGNDRVVYPLKEISKLKCRFDDFGTLGSDCKETLPVLNTKDYTKYIKKDGGYNEYTRLYTVLWGASYKYGWDVGHGGHQGVDIATAKGTPVYSIADGTVILAKKDPSWGNVVSVKHTIRGKVLVSNYAHLSKIDVEKGDIIKVGSKVGEVGSTGNSTGNHLHFQIDLEHLFHPFYYSWSTCPYGYYKITEEGVCFDELAEHTLDPLKFLESEGELLDSIEIQATNNTKITTKTKQTTNDKKYTNSLNNSNVLKGFDMSIFNKTVHTDMNSTSTDVKAVQKIYKDLGYYKGSIDGKYTKVESSIIDFQLKNKVIKTKSENGAGWFGPKTRAHTKSEYIKYLSLTEADKRGDEKVYIGNSTNSNTAVTTSRITEKISRTNILSREEIEEREINEFLDDNEINISLEELGGNIEIGTEFKIKLEVLHKINRVKRKAFRGALPAGITFEIDEKTVSVFPTKITYISNGVRNISLKGLKPGNTTLKIKLGNKVIKTFNLKVIGENVKVYPKTAKILSSSAITMGETKTAIVLFKDEANKKLINLPFNGSYILNTGDYSEVCIKRGELKDVSKIYKSECSDGDYVKNPVITYADTVGGLLLFDYKTLSSDYSTISLVGKGSGKTYSTKKINISTPKGLTNKYEYYDETIDLLERGIVDGTNKGYFLENSGLTEKDALVWIQNTLKEIKDQSTNPNTRAEVSKKLIELSKDKQKSFKQITRKQFLDKAYLYLVINDGGVKSSITYRDLADSDNKKVNAIFDKNNTWKDKFGENYFQPNEKLTRGEGAYFLSKALEKSQELY